MSQRKYNNNSFESAAKYKYLGTTPKIKIVFIKKFSDRGNNIGRGVHEWYDKQIFGSKREEGAGDYRKLQNEDHYVFHCSPKIIRVREWNMLQG